MEPRGSFHLSIVSMIKNEAVLGGEITKSVMNQQKIVLSKLCGSNFSRAKNSSGAACWDLSITL